MGKFLNAFIFKIILLSLFFFPALSHARYNLNIEFIVDNASYFEGKRGDVYKIDDVKTALTHFMNKHPQNINVGLRISGGKLATAETNECSNTQLESPIAKENAESIQAALNLFEPQGKSTIAYSIKKAFSDFTTPEEKNIIIVIAGGKDTCLETSPCDWLVSEAPKDTNIAVYMLGYNIISAHARNQLACFSSKFKGAYLDVSSADSILLAINNIVQSSINEESKRLELLDEKIQKQEQLRQKTRLQVEVSSKLPPLISDYIEVNISIIINETTYPYKDKIKFGDKIIVFNDPLPVGKYRMTIRYEKVKNGKRAQSVNKEIEFDVKEGLTTTIHSDATASLLSYDIETDVTYQ
jgi:hypothetical protein